MADDSMKKCSNCTRGLQSIAAFINHQGKECSTCEKCREKGKKGDVRPERREAHNKLLNEKRYDIAWRAKQLEESPGEYRAHNNEIHREWKANNAEHSRKWYRTNVNPRLDAIKRAAERRGIEWHLSDEEAKLMMLTACIYCKHIDLEVRVNGIDRLDSSKSYTSDNCVPCCKDCNYMKGTYDPKTFIERAKRIAECTEEFPDVSACKEHKRVNRLKT